MVGGPSSEFDIDIFPTSTHLRAESRSPTKSLTVLRVGAVQISWRQNLKSF